MDCDLESVCFCFVDVSVCDCNGYASMLLTGIEKWNFDLN